MHNANLEFRKIPSLDFLYEINENGTIFRNVKSKKQNKIKLDMHHSQTGYYVTFCRHKGKTKRIMIHRAVAECWLGPCPDGLEVDHIDRNSRNNDYRNLRYVSKSEQMKNRDHSNISKTGSQNLEEARRKRMKPVKLTNEQEAYIFESYAACSRFLSERYNGTFESFRYRLKRKSKKILGFKVEYLNAETKHTGSTEQEIVQQNSVDLTGDYKTAFNTGKVAETEDRIKHDHINVLESV